MTPIIVELKKPIDIAKANAGKYTHLTRKHEVEYVLSTATFLFIY